MQPQFWKFKVACILEIYVLNSPAYLWLYISKLVISFGEHVINNDYILGHFKSYTIKSRILQ